MALPDELLAVMAALFASKINCTVATFHDGGWTLKLGDDVNGFVAQRSFAPAELDAVRWLAGRACEHYPASKFAQLHPTAKLISRI
jgi:hypothetical protein